MWIAIGVVAAIMLVVIFRKPIGRSIGWDMDGQRQAGGTCCEIPDGQGGVVQVRCTNCNSQKCKDACGGAQKVVVVERPVVVRPVPVGTPAGGLGAGSSEASNV